MIAAGTRSRTMRHTQPALSGGGVAVAGGKGEPPSPANPPRLCLTLWTVNIDYHPLFNGPRWRVGCP